MKSSYIWFNDTFEHLIYERLVSAPGVYAVFRRDVLPYAQQRSLFIWKDYLFLQWKSQLPAHHLQYLLLQSSIIPESYCKFLLHQFDDWFANDYKEFASGISGSFFLFAYSPLFNIFSLFTFFCMMILLIFVVVFVLLIPFFFPGYYLTELMISFLPYIVTIAFVFMFLSLVNFRKRMYPGYEGKYRIFRGITFLVFCSLFFLYSKQFNAFYMSDRLPQYTDGSRLTVLFANIYKNNTSYEPIQQLIVDNDPDILMFVEFADHHYDNLKDFLQERYPYINRTTWSKLFIGSMVFSKYPIDNRADDFLQGARRYGYFSIPYQGQELYFYLVHTSSPDSYKHFLMRNEQLKTFVQNFQKHSSKRKHPNVIVVGDFNITPWSPHYSLLTDVFSGGLHNITAHLPFLLSRRLREFPLFQAHIDHIWISDSLNASSLRALRVPGSDHKGFLFTIKTD